MYFVVRNTYVDLPELAKVRAEHREFLATLTGHGLRSAGPLPQATPPGGVLIFESSSAEEVRAMLADDPLFEAGLVASQVIDEWHPVVGDVF